MIKLGILLGGMKDSEGLRRHRKWSMSPVMLKE